MWIALGGTFYHEIWLLRIIYVPYLINKTTDVLERVSEFIYLHSNIGYNELKSHILKKNSTLRKPCHIGYIDMVALRCVSSDDNANAAIVEKLFHATISH